MRFRLRTLMIVLAIGPPVVAGLWLSPHWLHLAIVPGLFMLAGAVAMAAMAFVINAADAIASPMFRFQVRDVLWLAVVLLLLVVLWGNNRNLRAVRVRAYELRTNLGYLKHYYHPDKPPPSPSDMDWNLADKPIP
jgi:hypothetical protein